MRPIPVFAGPSLTVQDRARPEFAFRPPAAAGDLIALLDDPPHALCLIDGYFDWCAAPWHKEILLLIAAGTTVLGAASLGALRAAELDGFGMVGVGVIYRAYRDGRLTGDDEVALIHAPERLHWAPLSLPMVEVRATLVRACRERLLGRDAARRIGHAVHDLHFDCRDWPAIERLCVESGLADRATAARLASLHVPLKRLDALRCLEEAQAFVADGTARQAPPVTVFIRALARQAGVEAALDRMLGQARRTRARPPPRRTGDGA